LETQNEEKYEPLAFPKPFKINDRNYWRLGDVRHWIQEREAQSQKVSLNKGCGPAPDGAGTSVAIYTSICPCFSGIKERSKSRREGRRFTGILLVRRHHPVAADPSRS